MTILVTGGLGFIGSNFVQFCLDRKIKIINVDKIDYSSNKFCNNKFLKYPNYNFYKDNIGNKKSLLKILYKHKPKYIVNFAAETHVDNSIIRPEKFIINNTLEYTSLLEVVRIFINKNKNSIRIFLNISTDEVYGSLNKKEKKFKETNKFYPNNPYSASKASCDLISRAWNKTFKIPIITTNCSNNFGPFQNKEKLIPKIILSALRGKKIPIYGKGTNIRDWIYVEDHCLAIFNLLKKGVSGETYNIGGRSEIKNINLVKKICNILDVVVPRKNNKKYSALIKFVKDRAAHDLRYGVNYSKIKKKLKLTFGKNFNKNLKNTILWYIKNKKYFNEKR
jgi:dTDP-glucose 4,6-dehydratase